MQHSSEAVELLLLTPLPTHLFHVLCSLTGDILAHTIATLSKQKTEIQDIELYTYKDTPHAVTN